MENDNRISWPWRGSDERLVIEKMIRDPHSKDWEECSNFVRRCVYTKAKNIPLDRYDEITQEVMYRITKYLPGFRFQCTLKTWLNQIIESCIIDMHRREQMEERSQFSLADSHNDSDHEGEGEEFSVSEVKSAEDTLMINEEIRNGIEALLEYVDTHPNPTRNRLVIRMVIFEGASYAEAAKAVGCSTPVVGYIVREAQRHAREKMGHRQSPTPINVQRQEPDDLDRDLLPAFEYDDDVSWSTLYSWLKSQVRNWVYTSHSLRWQGEEEETIEDIVSDAIMRVLDRMHKANRGEANLIKSLYGFARQVAHNSFIDLLRKDRKNLRLSQLITNHEEPVSAPLLIEIEEAVLYTIYSKQFFKLLAREVVTFPKKQKEAVLRHEARHIDRMIDPAPLLHAYEEVGIHLKDYSNYIPVDLAEKRRHSSLLQHAYRRLSRILSTTTNLSLIHI